MTKRVVNTRKLVACAMLVALTIVLENYVSFKVLTYQIGFYFIPIAVCAMLFGPVYAAAVYVLADVVGYLMNPIGAYIPPLTVMCAVVGVIYGLIYYRKTIPATLSQAALWVLLTVSVVTVCVTLTANCYFLAKAYGSFYVAMVPGRFIQTAIMLPMQLVLLPLVWTRLLPRLSAWSSKAPKKAELPALQPREAARPKFYAWLGLGLAVLTLVCCLLPVLSFAAIVLGVFAVRLCDRLAARAKEIRGTALTGLSLAWVGLVVAVLASILYVLFLFAADRLVGKLPFLAVFQGWFDALLSIF